MYCLVTWFINNFVVIIFIIFYFPCLNFKIQNQLNDMMDQLIKDVSAGTYSTKKSFTRYVGIMLLYASIQYP